MKNIILFILCFISHLTFATIRRVNNNSGVIPVAGLVYTAFVDAQTDASPGDTIYIEPSSTNYQFLNGVSKRLVIIGNGYSAGTNAGLVSPLPQNTLESKVSGFESAGGGGFLKVKVGAENSVFIGLSFQNAMLVECGNVLIERCTWVPNAAITLNSNNNILRKCITKQFGSTNGAVKGTGQNNLIENCILGDGLENLVNPIVSHCFIDEINNVNNGVFTNCIVNSTISGTNNTFSNCLRIATTFPTPAINNNIENIALGDIFLVTNPMSGNGAFDKDYRLKVGSPAIGTGTGGADIGPFGGSSPYRLSGQAPIPIITNFFLSTTGSTASGLTGSITIQSNN